MLVGRFVVWEYDKAVFSVNCEKSLTKEEKDKIIFIVIITFSNCRLNES